MKGLLEAWNFKLGPQGWFQASGGKTKVPSNEETDQVEAHFRPGRTVQFLGSSQEHYNLMFAGILMKTLLEDYPDLADENSCQVCARTELLLEHGSWVSNSQFLLRIPSQEEGEKASGDTTDIGTRVYGGRVLRLSSNNWWKIHHAAQRPKPADLGGNTQPT